MSTDLPFVVARILLSICQVTLQFSNIYVLIHHLSTLLWSIFTSIYSTQLPFIFSFLRLHLKFFTLSAAMSTQDNESLVTAFGSFNSFSPWLMPVISILSSLTTVFYFGGVGRGMLDYPSVYFNRIISYLCMSSSFVSFFFPCSWAFLSSSFLLFSSRTYCSAPELSRYFFFGLSAQPPILILLINEKSIK